MASILSPLSAPNFAATKSGEEIARRLRVDEALVTDGKLCSWVAWHLPGYDTERGHDIATHLAPVAGLSHEIKSMLYENLLEKIRRHLKNAGRGKTREEAIRERKIASASLHPSDISIALKILAQLQEMSVIKQNTPAVNIIAWLKQQNATPESYDAPLQDDIFTAASSNIPKPPPTPRKRHCYICRLALQHPHPSQPSMCIPCGAFNLASSQLSTSPRLFLPGITTLVTGARINLGYHTALRLLRCGAHVIATTRYPRDAVTRYLEESDSVEWRERLRVVGADFRCAADAFALVDETKRCLSEWAGGGDAKLHVLINNAAQTLTDSLKKEERAVKRENILAKDMKSEMVLIKGAYKARVRGEGLPMTLEGAEETTVPFHLQEMEVNAAEAGAMGDFDDPNDVSTAEIEPYSKSSWVQSLSDIPYEDVMSAHAVNTFVPLILCRELLPLMGCDNRTMSATSSDIPTATPKKPLIKPQAYIINVSSREGIFEDRINSSAKRGKHVHTNMSKAALNMITETEAATAWQSKRVAMNTVDPGYMSAAPEYEHSFDGKRPIGWEDGAGRVLWPIAVGEMEGMAVWGRFLKHYGAVNVDPGAGRG